MSSLALSIKTPHTNYLQTQIASGRISARTSVDQVIALLRGKFKSLKTLPLYNPHHLSARLALSGVIIKVPMITSSMYEKVLKKSRSDQRDDSVMKKPLF